MNLSNIIYELYFNKYYFSVYIRTITTIVLILNYFKKSKLFLTTLEFLYFPNVLITFYNILFTIGEYFSLPILKGEDYFSLINILSTITKIILLILLIKLKIKFKINSVILTLILWIIFSLITKLKDYEANLLEYFIIFCVSLIFCFMIN